MTFRGRDIWHIRTPRSGVAWKTELLEYYAVAHWDNMSYQQFAEMPAEYQEYAIAAYRTHTHIEAVIAQDHAQQAKASAASRKFGRRGR